jgi:hypothetical protein
VFEFEMVQTANMAGSTGAVVLPTRVNIIA